MTKKKIFLIYSFLMFSLICLFLSYAVHGQRARAPLSDTDVEKPAYEKSKGPKVLFDEGHHNAHTTSTYEWSVDVIKNDGYVISVNKLKFTEDVLKGYDILIISNALNEKNVPWWGTRPYYPAFTQEEVDIVHNWVKDGGGLFLIADHAPFGTAAFDLAKRFGVIMSEGTAYDPGNLASYLGEKTGGILDRGHITIFTREKGTLLDHPITRGRDETEKVNKVKTSGGQSLKAPEGSGLLKFSENAYDEAPITKEKRAIPGHLQGAAFSYGKGRIVVIGEALLFRGDKRVRGERSPRKALLPIVDTKLFLLNIMHYLSDLLDPGITISEKSIDLK